MTDIFGTPFSDTRTGTAGDDRIYGFGSGDRLYGRAGVDQLFGGTGNDQLFGEDGWDRLVGGSGTDVLNGGTGNDIADYSGSPASVLVDLQYGSGLGGDANGDTYVSIEYVDGSQFQDWIIGGNTPSTLNGNGGNDVLDGGEGTAADYLGGGNGDDLLIGRDGPDTLSGGAGADNLDGGAGFDAADYLLSTVAVAIDFQLGTATGGDAAGDRFSGIEGIRGSQANDTLNGNEGGNQFYGYLGDDALNGRGGNDQLSGYNGNDTLGGGDGNDNLAGGSGDDALYSGEGNDSLSGDDGNDTANGGAGNDQIWGDAGADTLVGGAGTDRFIFWYLEDSVPTAQDTIVDFRRAQGDKIDIAGVDAVTATTELDEAFTFIGRAAFTGVAGQLRVGGTGNTIIQADVDGDRIADFQIRLLGTVTLTAGDFVL